ncbi:hypothetical protein [Neisseria leonii]|uniref:hypothetical protein n=1 Tax=Neisseria leonii TaxID=2995413 RepID=UPI00237B7146|nr:hypothetical protein [Neisseria sp. 3986]MDD9325127.1 hypothetical protein [Neisseria sp. 3986]
MNRQMPLYRLMLPVAALTAAILLLWPQWRDWRQSLAREAHLKNQYQTLRTRTAALPAVPDTEAATAALAPYTAADNRNWPQTAAEYRLTLLAADRLPDGTEQLHLSGAYPDLYRLLYSLIGRTPAAQPRSWQLRPSESGASLNIVLQYFPIPDAENSGSPDNAAGARR